jgi:CRISPR/Cas system CSM-associated protein Csm3 (group 7 of RAMP superfamily)
MNPYDFVRTDWSKPPVRRAYAPHDRLGGWTGRVEGQIMAETPLFVQGTAPARGGTGPKRFQANAQGTPIIPASSLKGLFRGLVETVAPGCWWLYDGTYRDHVDYRQKLPQPFQQCSALDELCPACRLFGLVHRRGALLLGKVSFDDAICIREVRHDAIFTPILDAPKPRHRAWYLDSSGQWVAGRKFYFHQSSIQTERGPRTSQKGEPLNQHIAPLGAGTAFTFTAHFTNVADDELPPLLYALALEQEELGHDHDLRHKLGYAKPAGLGSVHVQLRRLVRWRASARYTGGKVETYEGETLHALVSQQIAPYVADTASATLQDLRRIWRWPPTGTYRYPDRNWFSANPAAPISQTP